MNGLELFNSNDVYITSRFGNRYINGKKEFHNGTDYGTYRKKIPCVAPYNGIITKVGIDKFGANFFYIDFLNGYVGMYYHLDSIKVESGKVVLKNEVLGIVGSTGQSTGIHLHFSLIKNNSRTYDYYKADYLDFEKEDIFAKVVFRDIKVSYNDKELELNGFEYRDRNLIYIKDLIALGFEVSYDKKNDIVLLKDRT